MMENSKRKHISIIAVQSPSNDRSKNDNPPGKLNWSFAFRPIYYFLRVYGFMPFTIVYDSIGEAQKTKVTLRDILWFLVSLCVYLLAFKGNSNWEETHTVLNVTPVIKFGGNILFGAETVFSIIGIIMDHYNKLKLIHMLQKFDQFDKKARQKSILNPMIGTKK